MVDPCTIIGTVSAAGAIVVGITNTIHKLVRLRETFKEADVALRLLIAELSAVKAALLQIEDWATYNSDGNVEGGLERGFKLSLEGCQIALDLLWDEVASLCEGFEDNDDVFTARLRTVWKDSIMKEHQQRLHCQIGALQLLLQAAHM
jgi:hypothetical protein